MSSSRPFFCDLCSKVFTRNENLERHKRSKHQGESHRPFECFRCQARFSRRDVCKRHADRCRARQNGTQGHDGGFEPASQGLFNEQSSSSATSGTSVSPEAVHGDTVPEPLDGYSPGNLWARPVQIPATSTFGSTQLSQDAHIAAYFKYFHPSLPLLHRPSIVKNCPDLLAKIIVAIGSLYSSHSLPEPDASSCRTWSQSLWEAGHDELGRLSSLACQGLQRTWVMQAWLLHIIYGAFMGDAAQHHKAKSLLRGLVDTVHDLGLLKQAAVSTESPSWIDALGTDEAGLHDRWMRYADEEAMKLCMHTVLFLDFHILHPCNIRSLTSAVDLSWELPFSSALWESETAADWVETLFKEPRALAILQPNEELCFQDPPAQSLFLAMQSLMSDTPNPDTVTALEACPISIMFLLANLDSLVRDFTRSYYQLPPTLTDPSAFHILTQSQNRQISAVLRHVSRMVKERPRSDGDHDGAIWNGIERAALSIKIALYKPDDLLIGGIVDNSVVAGLATATHLTLGRYTGSRRSLHSLMQHNSGDDAVLFMLEDTTDILSAIFGHNAPDALSEAPWVTVLTYRILLASWRSFRWAASELRGKDQLGSKTRYDTPSIIFNAILDAAFEEEDTLTPFTSEVHFTEAIRRFWKDRSIWSMGSSMVPVLNEIISVGI